MGVFLINSDIYLYYSVLPHYKCLTNIYYRKRKLPYIGNDTLNFMTVIC